MDIIYFIIIMFLFVVLGFCIGCWFIGLLMVNQKKSETDKIRQITELTEERNTLKHVLMSREEKHSTMLHQIAKLKNRIIELEHYLKVINTTSPNQTTVQQVGLNLNAEDLKRLIMLCHPDKHGGKTMALEMTKKLIELRG